MMKISRISNPARTASGGIDLVIETEEFGIIPYHAVPTDPEESDSYQLYLRAMDGEFGAVTPYSPQVLTAEQKKNAVVDVVQDHLDKEAKSYGYDDIKSAVTYADEPSVVVFQVQGRAFRAWRSLVWEKCYRILEQVEAESIPEPTIPELLAMLPALALP